MAITLPSKERIYGDRRRQYSMQRIGIRASHKLGVAKVIHPLDAEGRANCSGRSHRRAIGCFHRSEMLDRRRRRRWIA